MKISAKFYFTDIIIWPIWGLYLGVDLLGHNRGICSALVDAAKEFSRVVVSIYCWFPPAVWVPVPLHPCQLLVLWCITHIFIHLFTTLTFSFVMCLLNSLAHFKNGIVCLPYWFVGIVYIFWVQVILVTYVLKSSSYCLCSVNLCFKM